VSPLAPSISRNGLGRGQQLDGRSEVRFERGLVPSRSRQLRRSGDNPSLTRLRTPGCYAYQIDGLRFSYRVIFEAKLFAS
jgi:hypothetical protein